MAEIKSTLDLVLERTKNLTLTQEEKKALNLKELEGRMRGLIRKFLTGLADQETLKAELKKIRKDGKGEERALLKSLLVEQIDPDEENRKVLLLFEEILGLSTGPISAAIDDFRRKTAAAEAGYSLKLYEELSGRQISGSAVVPNLSVYEEWARFREKSRVDFQDRVRLILQGN